MDCGDDDGESGAEEEQESSSPAPSGFTCRKKGALAADLSSLPRPTTPRGHPKGCPPVPAFPVLSRGSPDLQDPPQPRVPPRPRNWGSPPAGRRPTHQSCVLPGAFAGPPGRQGCRPPALLRHEPRALRRDSGEGGETRVRSRRRAHGAPQPPRPRRALEGPARGRRVQPPRAPEPGAQLAGQRAASLGRRRQRATAGLRGRGSGPRAHPGTPAPRPPPGVPS